MAKGGQVNLVGVFASPELAARAVRGLRRAGFRGGLVEVVARDERRPDEVIAKGPTAGQAVGPKAKARRKRADAPSKSDPSGIVGGIVGAAATVAELIPGVGPKLSGHLATDVPGVPQTATPSGARAALSALGFREEDARSFERRIDAGYVLVVVRANTRHRQAASVLRGCGADETRRVS